MPSTQAFELHSSLAVQAMPSAFLPPQILVTVSQTLPFRQSELLAQGLHLPASQRLLPHDSGPGGLHSPMPSQVAATVPPLGMVHAAGLHCTFGAASAQT